VTTPQLIIDSGPDDDFISIRCSSCDDFVVRIEGNTLSNKVLMRGLYDLHFKQVHRPTAPRYLGSYGAGNQQKQYERDNRSQQTENQHSPSSHKLDSPSTFMRRTKWGHRRLGLSLQDDT